MGGVACERGNVAQDECRLVGVDLDGTGRRNGRGGNPDLKGKVGGKGMRHAALAPTFYKIRNEFVMGPSSARVGALPIWLVPEMFQRAHKRQCPRKRKQHHDLIVANCHSQAYRASMQA